MYEGDEIPSDAMKIPRAVVPRLGIVREDLGSAL
jgi:hypothetical protein